MAIIDDAWNRAGVTGGDMDEAELITRCTDGDTHAFDLLITRHRPAVYAACLRITGNREDAHDAMQETLMRAWRGLAKFRFDASFRVWLYRIATNAALAEIKQRATHPLLPGTLPDEPATVRPIDERVVDQDAVQTALNQLPPTFRAAIVLRECVGCSYDEIAELQDVPLNTVRSRISRARQALLVLLKTDPDGGSGIQRVRNL